MFSTMNFAVFCINFHTIANFVTFTYKKKGRNYEVRKRNLRTKKSLTNKKNHLRTNVGVSVCNIYPLTLTILTYP
jgi:hypothetical protein